MALTFNQSPYKDRVTYAKSKLGDCIENADNVEKNEIIGNVSVNLN